MYIFFDIYIYVVGEGEEELAVAGELQADEPARQREAGSLQPAPRVPHRYLCVYVCVCVCVCVCVYIYVQIYYIYVYILYTHKI